MAPSSLHHDLQWMALRWLGVRATASGIRGATEVYVQKGYVADAAALCSLQHRFWDQYRGSISLSCSSYVSCIFEIKVSRADYLATFPVRQPPRKCRVYPYADLHWIVTPRGVTTADEHTGFWGLLEISGGGLRQVRPPRITPRTLLERDRFAHRLIWPMMQKRQQWRRVKTD